MVRVRISNLWAKIICSLMAVGLCVNTAAALSGSGTEQDPWLIQSLADFDEFVGDANYWDAYTRLETDVNLAGRTYSTAVIAPDVNNANWIFDSNAFTGVFDGNDHRIIDLTIDDGGAGNDWLGLFGSIHDGQVMNLGLEGGSVSGDRYYVGGLVGLNAGDVSNCYFTGNVNGVILVGGLVGENCYLGSVSDCSSASDVSGDHYVGGLVGFNNAGSLSKSYSTGYVSGRDSVGGLAGGNVGTISNCYFAGRVSASSAVGGLVGENGIWGPPDGFVGAISRSYSTGNVQGVVYVGGLVGDNNYGDVESSFWDIQTSSEPNMCGYQDFGSTGCDPNYGLPTSQMKQKSTFQDWDFINVWNIGENQTYPYLRTVPAGDINKDKIVNFLDLCIVADQWMHEDD